MCDGIGMMMDSICGPTLGARVAASNRMIVIALNLDDLFARDIGDKTAMGHADSAVGALASDRLSVHGVPAFGTHGYTIALPVLAFPIGDVDDEFRYPLSPRIQSIVNVGGYTR